MIAARTEVQLPVTPEALVRFGADMTMDATSSEFTPSETDLAIRALAAQFPPRDDLAFGVRGDVVLQLGPRLEITPGVRVDLYLEGATFGVGFDPRLAARSPSRRTCGSSRPTGSRRSRRASSCPGRACRR